MWFVYIIESIPTGRRYIGYTADWKKRLDYHNNGANSSTQPYRPYKLAYLEELSTKHDALVRERQLKSYKGGDSLKKLLKS